MSENEPGWQPDPTGRFEHRYWDGTQWTDNVANAGVASTDAYTPGAGGGDVTVPDAPAAAEPPAPEPAAPGGWGDPTAAQPTPPPAPPPFAGGPAGAAPAAAAGSRKGLLIGGGILAAVAVAVAALLLLGGDDDGDRDRIHGQLVTQMRADSDLSEDQADCVADAIIDEVGVEKLQDVDLTADEPPEEIADELGAAVFGSLDRCDVDPAELGGTGDSGDDSGVDGGGDGTYGSDPDLDELYDRCEDGDYQACDDLFNESPSGSEYEEFGDTCGGRNEPSGYCADLYGDSGSDDGGIGSLPDDFEDQLADIYESSMGLDREKAECLAGKIAEAISSGDLSEEEAMSDVFGYISDCDIDMSEING